MTPEQVDQWRDRQMSKAAEQRRFRALEEVAATSQVNARRHGVRVKKVAAPKVVKERVPKQSTGKRQSFTHCQDCGVQFKRGGERVPGARRHVRNGLCYLCLNGKHGQSTVVPRPEKCTECQRPLRGSSETAASRPGTVQHRSHGLCTGCSTPIEKRRKPVPERCVTCDRPMWAAGSTKHPKRPGAIQHRSRGRCQNCAKKEDS